MFCEGEYNLLFHGLAVLLALSPLHWSADQELQPEELILAYVEAHNRHDQIAGITAVLSIESTEQISTALGAVMAWASEERADVLEELMQSGEFVYSAEAAERLLALLREWRQATRHGHD